MQATPNKTNSRKREARIRKNKLQRKRDLLNLEREEFEEQKNAFEAKKVEYQKELKDSRESLEKIRRGLDRQRKSLSTMCEEAISRILTWLKVPFLDEKELKRLKYDITPDFLFKEIFLSVNDFRTNWFEVKDITFERLRNHREQIEKYEEEYGSGLIICWRSSEKKPFIFSHSLVISLRYLWENSHKFQVVKKVE